MDVGYVELSSLQAIMASKLGLDTLDRSEAKWPKSGTGPVGESG